MSARTVLISGINRGLGLETTKSLVMRDYHVIGTARSLDKCEELLLSVSQMNRKEHLTVIELDVRDASAIATLSQSLKDKDIYLDGLINNAGVCLDGDGSFDVELAKLSSLTQPILESTFSVNTFAPIYLIQACYNQLKDGASILNVSSSMGSLQQMSPGWIAYRTSKAALNAATLILSAEFRPRNIAVNSICPGWARTDMGGPEAPLEPAVAAESIVSLLELTLTDSSVTGKFFNLGKEIAF